MNTASLIKELVYNDSKVAITVLIDTDNTKEIRIAMREGQEMKKHQTAFPIVVEIFEGAVDFGVEDEVLQLKKGDLIALEGGVAHDLKAKVNSIIRLSLSKKDQVQRVENVVR